MGRPHTEFVYTQAISWKKATGLAHREGLDIKILSEDPTSGEMTAILRLPPGFERGIVSAFEEEFYVLSGELTLAGTTLQRDGYGRVPGRISATWSTESGADIILFVNMPELGALPDVVAINAVEVPWDSSRIPPEMDYMGARLKPLRLDENGRLRVWLLATSPHNFPIGDACAVETHSCAEECFMLSGEITGPRGVMSAGAYFWRPRDVLHGPFGSREGNLALLRFRDGVQDTTWHAPVLPFRYDQPYSPVLPAALAGLQKTAPLGAARY